MPENYYVTASPSEVAGLTYMLPATPAGYVLYGAWGTISRNQCADSVTWYVEYDPASGTPGDGTNAYQVTVTKVGGDSTAGEFSSARPVASTPITVNGIEGYVFSKDGSYAVIGWTTGGAAITLAGPVSHGDIQSLVSRRRLVGVAQPDRPADRRTGRLPGACRQRVRERQPDAHRDGKPEPECRSSDGEPELDSEPDRRVARDGDSEPQPDADTDANRLTLTLR